MKKNSKKEKSSLEFEIEFYEKLITNKPDFIDVLIPLAELYTKAGCYNNGLKIDQRLSRLKPDNPVIHYNLACSYSLLGKVNEAVEALKKAVELGYNDFEYMNTDPDLATIRKDKRYIKIAEKVSRKKKG